MEEPEAQAEAPEQVQEPTQEPEEGQPAEAQSEETFASSFDPNELPVEVQPAYKSMLADYTRKTQELAGQRKEAERDLEFMQALRSEETREETFRRLASSLGYELDDEDFEGEIEDEPDDSRLADFEERLSRYEQSQVEAQVADWASQEVQAIEQETGREFGESELQMLRTLSYANPSADGLPDVRGAYAALLAMESDLQRRWIESKNAPRRPGKGTSADRRIDHTNREERLAAMEEAIEAAGFSPE